MTTVGLWGLLQGVTAIRNSMDSTNDYRAVDALQTSMTSLTKAQVTLQHSQHTLTHNLDTNGFLASIK